MSYHISGDRLGQHNLVELLGILTKYFKSIDTDFYVIGAAARDIVLSGIYKRRIRRNTRDLDIAIMIADWQKFTTISEGLCNMSDIKKSKDQKQRFVYKENLLLDIVPFGEIAAPDNNIYWPPDGISAMSVAGFIEMAKQSLSVNIDGRLEIFVASLPAITVLKLYAWQDRHGEKNDDAYDIGLFIEEYLEINIDRAGYEHTDIFEDPNFRTYVAGAILLGRDIRMSFISNNEILHGCLQIIEAELDKNEGSPLVNQIVETHPSKKYEEVHEAFVKIAAELKT